MGTAMWRAAPQGRSEMGRGPVTGRRRGREGQKGEPEAPCLLTLRSSAPRPHSLMVALTPSVWVRFSVLPPPLGTPQHRFYRYPFSVWRGVCLVGRCIQKLHLLSELYLGQHLGSSCLCAPLSPMGFHEWSPCHLPLRHSSNQHIL